jgi:hypothetical protein
MVNQKRGFSAVIDEWIIPRVSGLFQFAVFFKASCVFRMNRRKFLSATGLLSLSALTAFLLPSKLFTFMKACAASNRLSNNIGIPTPCKPKASDVIMRSMGIHPHNQSDPHDTMRALRNFHANCLEWTYIEDINFIQKVKRFGQLFVVDWSNKAKPFNLKLDPDRTAQLKFRLGKI